MSERRQVWLRPNRRASWLALIPAVLTLVVGVAWLCFADAAATRGLAVGLVLVGGILTAATALLMTQPRLAYEGNSLLVYLRPGRPIRVPIDVVECFFLGQGPTMLGGGESESQVTSTIVVRLAEAAEEWKHVDVRPQLGHWCDGYITIRGTWCEPIDGDLIRDLNHQLVTVKRGLREAAEVK